MRRVVVLSVVALIGCSNGEGEGPKPDAALDGPAVDAPAVDPDIPPLPDFYRPADQPWVVDMPVVTDGPKPTDGPPAQVVITEVMPNPAAVSDTDGEWIELYNAGGAPVDLSGWILKDDGSESHTIAGPLTIGVGQYLVLGRSAQSATNGGVTVHYEYSSFFLANSEDEVVLQDASGAEVDRVAWTSAWGIKAGLSHQLRNVALDNNLAASWCLATTTWSGSSGDLGTPGAANDCPAPDGGVQDAGVPDAAVTDGPISDAPVTDAGVPDAWIYDGSAVPYCPPPGTTFNNPPTNLGDLNGQPCGYACWGSGNLFNECATGYWQFCLPQGVFAPCQPKP